MSRFDSGATLTHASAKAALAQGLARIEAGATAVDCGALAQIGQAGDAPVGGAPLPAACDRAVAAAPPAPRPLRITAPSGAIPARMRRRARHSPQLNRRLQQSSQTDSNNCDMLSYYE